MAAQDTVEEVDAVEAACGASVHSGEAPEPAAAPSVEQADEKENGAAEPAKPAEEAAGTEAAAPVSPNRGLPGLTLSQSPGRLGGMAHDADDDEDVELPGGIPVVSLGSYGNTADEPLESPDASGMNLISRDLLDEMSHEPDEWNQGRGASTPPLGGYHTPSEPNTPSPRGHEGQQPQYYQGNQNTDGLMCIDQWDWKTDAPEFVPGSMKGLGGFNADPQVGYQAPWPMQQQQQQPQPPIGKGGLGPPDSAGGSENARLGQLRSNYEWQLRSKGDELRDMQDRMNRMEIETAQVRASWEIERRGLVRQIGHYRAVLERYCIPLEEAGAPSYSMEETGEYFPAFEPSVPSQWPSTASNQAPNSGAATGASGQGSFGNQAAGYGGGSASQQGPGAFASGTDGSFRAPQQGHYGPSSGAGASPASGSVDANAVGSGAASSSLDSKMRQLNNLLQADGKASPARNRNPSPPGESASAEPGQEGYTGSSIASTLRSMFPHATIRTKNLPAGEEGEEGEEDEQGEPGEQDALDHCVPVPPPPLPPSQGGDREIWEANEYIIKRVDDLEVATSGHVDERAMRALQTLQHKEKLEALVKVEELVKTQGGQCRNLSSILQSVCRKLEKRRAKPSSDERLSNGAGRESHGDRGNRTQDVGAPPPPDPPPPPRSGRDARGGRRARRQDEDGDAFDTSESEGGAAPARSAPPVQAHRSPASNRTKSWADIESGDEDEGREAGLLPAGPGFCDGTEEAEKDAEDPWTPERVDAAARQGFELRRRGDNWDLKIIMSGLKPPLTESGMERYCKWLRTRLTSFCEEHGKQTLRRCRGEVDFSHNNLNNEMVWMLLETLAQHEVHTALLKLFANRISQGGVLAICEFIRMNEKAEALYELHLSHNQIDDDSALELLRTLHMARPRYPPRRPAESGSGEPALTPVWLRMNHNRIRDPARVVSQAEEEGISTCTSWDRQVCGTSKCVRRDCALVHLYSFNVQDVSKNERTEENGEGSRARRDRQGQRPERQRQRKDGSRRDSGKKDSPPPPGNGHSSPAASPADSDRNRDEE